MKHKGLFKYFALSIMIAALVFAVFPAAVRAAGEDLKITGGTEGTDYTYDNGVLTILKNGEYTIEMAQGKTTTTDRIVFNRDAALTSVKLTLKSVTIEADGTVLGLDGTVEGQTPAALDLKLVLDGTSKLKSKQDTVSAGSKATITVSGSGTLDMTSSEKNGIVLAGGSSLKMTGGVLKINAGTCGISVDENSSASEVGFEGGETEITAGTNAINLKYATKKDPVFKSGYTHKNYDGATAASATEVSDTDLVDGEGVSDNYALITPAYKITYNLNGGALPSGASNPTTYTRVDTFTLKNPARSNYTFLGWSGTGVSGKSKSVTVKKGSTGARSYAANWQENTVAINYKAGTGGSVNRTSETVKRVTGTAQGSTATPEKGYKFRNWTDQNGNVVGTSAKYVPQKSGTLYAAATYTANFEKQTFVITLNPNGGKLSGKTGIQKKTCSYGQVITLPRPTKTGYLFNYWKGSAYKAGAKYTVTENHTFTAQWKKRSSTTTRRTTRKSSTSSKKSSKTSSSTTKKRATAKTGDAGQTTAWIVMIAMLAVIVTTAALRRRENKT